MEMLYLVPSKWLLLCNKCTFCPLNRCAPAEWMKTQSLSFETNLKIWQVHNRVISTTTRLYIVERVFWSLFLYLISPFLPWQISASPIETVQWNWTQNSSIPCLKMWTHVLHCIRTQRSITSLGKISCFSKRSKRNEFGARKSRTNRETNSDAQYCNFVETSS